MIPSGNQSSFSLNSDDVWKCVAGSKYSHFKYAVLHTHLKDRLLVLIQDGFLLKINNLLSTISVNIIFKRYHYSYQVNSKLGLPWQLLASL